MHRDIYKKNPDTVINKADKSGKYYKTVVDTYYREFNEVFQ